MNSPKQAPIKVLVVVPFVIWPPHFGSSERVYNYVKKLAQSQEIQLSILYTDYAQVTSTHRNQEHWEDKVNVQAVGPSRRWAQALNPWLLLQGLLLIRRDRPDVILCAHLWASLHAMILYFLTGVPFVLDDHNAEYIRLERMGKHKIARLVRMLEKIACHFARKVICVSEADKEHLVNLGIPTTKMTSIYNAIDTEQYYPTHNAQQQIRQNLGLTEQQPLLLFFGKLDYQPNAEAVEIIIQEIMPLMLSRLPDVHIVICGYNPPTNIHQHPQLTFTGFVPKIEDYINASDVVIVPLISGGGTKLKIVQTLACGRPVVTTAIGSEGIEETGEWMQVADNWEQFADLVTSIITHPATLSQKQLDKFRYTYSWDRITEKFIQVFKEQIKVNL